jgi:hypothetical protein
VSVNVDLQQSRMWFGADVIRPGAEAPCDARFNVAA